MFFKALISCFVILLYEQVLGLDFENIIEVTGKNPKSLLKQHAVLTKSNITDHIKLLHEIVNKTARNRDIVMHIQAEVEPPVPHVSKQREEYYKTLYKTSVAILSLIVICLAISIILRPYSLKMMISKSPAHNASSKVDPDYNKVWLGYRDESKEEGFQDAPFLKPGWQIKRMFGNAVKAHLKDPFYDQSVEKNSKDTHSLIKNIEISSCPQSMEGSYAHEKKWLMFQRNTDLSALKNSENVKNLNAGNENPTCGLCISQSNGNFITCPKVPFPGHSILGDSEDVEVLMVDQNDPLSIKEVAEISKISLVQENWDFPRSWNLPFHRSVKKNSDDNINPVEGVETTFCPKVPNQSFKREDIEILVADPNDPSRGQSDITKGTGNSKAWLVSSSRNKAAKEILENVKTRALLQRNTPPDQSVKENPGGSLKNLVEDLKESWDTLISSPNVSFHDLYKKENPDNLEIAEMNENSSLRDHSKKEISKESDLLLAYLENLQQDREISKCSAPDGFRNSIEEITEDKEKLISFLMSPFPCQEMTETKKNSDVLMAYLEDLYQARKMAEDSEPHLRGVSRDSIVEFNGNNEKLTAFLLSPFSPQPKDENWKNIKSFNDF